MATLLHAVALCALAAVSAVDQVPSDSVPMAELKPEYIRKSSPPAAIASNSTSKVFVFLQKFPLLGRFLGLEVFHTEVLVCPRNGFSKDDQDALDGKIAGMTDFAEIDKSWWSTMTANCVELGYGGSYCRDECCSVPHNDRTMHYALHESRSVITNADTSKRSLYIYGTGNFDGNVAFHHTCDHKCWSNWAGTDYNILTTNCNTFTSTVLHSVYGLSEKKPHLGVSDLVHVTGHCPGDRKALLSHATPSKVDSSFCGMLDNRFMEGIMTREVCSKVGKALNITIPHCQASAKQVWDMAAKMCHKGTDIEKWFCGMAHDKTMENKTVGEICAKVEDWQMKTFNVSLPDAVCHQLVENVWTPLAQMCPKDRKTALSQAPPSNTGNPVCAMLENKFVEGLTVNHFCSKMHRDLNISMPLCQAKAEHYWDMGANICKISPGNIGKWFCGIANNKTMENKTVDEMCVKIKDFEVKKFNLTLPDGWCHTLVENMWEPLAQMCPKDHKIALSQATPDSMARLSLPAITLGEEDGFAPVRSGNSLGKTVPEATVHNVARKALPTEILI